MHKYLLSTMALAAALTSPAAAAPPQIRPYIGFDLQRYQAEYNDNFNLGGGLALDGDAVLEDSLNGGNIHAGARVGRYFGVEAGYFRTREESKNVAAGDVIGPGPTVAAVDFSSDVQLQGGTLDGMGYLPLGFAPGLELIGTAGVSYTKADVEIAGVSDDESEVGFRAGAGAQFGLTERLNARALARYQSADFDNVADRAWIYTAGLNYGF